MIFCLKCMFDAKIFFFLFVARDFAHTSSYGPNSAFSWAVYFFTKNYIFKNKC